MNTAELKRFTYRQLNTQAKQAFRRIQINRPEGGLKQNYRYKGWDILINNGIMLQVVHYNVIKPEVMLKRSTVITL